MFAHEAPRTGLPDSVQYPFEGYKNVNFRHAVTAFTVPPESRALSCCVDLPGGSALYAISVRQFIDLHSGFLQTFPHENALAFD